IKFEIGVWNGSDWTWTTELDLGETQSSNYTLTRDRDTFSFTGVPSVRAKLAQTPANSVVIYNSQRETLSSADFEPIPDTEGNLYHTQLVPIAGLTLYNLFHQVFVIRCGFSSFQTNIPNFVLGRCD